MKRINLILFICFCLLLTGCNVEKVVVNCKSSTKQSNYSIKSNYKIISRKDIVEKVTIKQVIKSGDNDVLKKFEKQLLEQYKSNNNFYGGYKYDIKIVKKQLIADIAIDYEKINMKKFVKDNVAMKDYVNKKNQFTLNGAKKLYQSTGAKCE